MTKMMLALDRHVEERWVKMYITRWLEAPIAKANGEIVTRDGKGTPQGGVISPLLANLYLHYTFRQVVGPTVSKFSFCTLCR